jgi:uncharacterized protein YjbJ (UPF0337 family)
METVGNASCKASFSARDAGTTMLFERPCIRENDVEGCTKTTTDLGWSGEDPIGKVSVPCYIQTDMNPNNENAKSSLTDNVEGNAKIIAGKVKQEAGKLVQSPELVAKGIAEKSEGHVQKKIGEIKKVFGE